MASVTASTTPQTNPALKEQPEGAGGSAASAETPGDDAASEVEAAQIATDKPRASLARRMGLIAAGWIIVLLLGGGIALERTLTRQVAANFDEQLEEELKEETEG